MRARVNWMAVVLAAVVYFMMGAIWYTVLAEPWRVGVGKTQEQLMAHNGGSPMPYIITLICNVILASVLAQLIVATGKATAMHGLRVGFLAWAGFIATTIMMDYQYEGRTFTIWAINTGYPLVGMLMMGAVLGAWTKKAPIASAAKV
jgi:Protein of unknown function (DUF1761)